MRIGIGIGIPFSKALGAGGAPVNTVAPVVSGSNTEGETLTTTDGTWSGSTPQELTRQWQRSTDGGATWLNVDSYITQAINTWPIGNATFDSGTTNPNFFASNFSLEEDNTTNIHYTSFPTGNILTTGSRKFSINAKPNGRDWIYVYLYDFPEGSGKGAWFNVATGQIGTVEAGVTATILQLDNGWYQCTIERTITGDVNDNGGVILANADGVVNYTGTTGLGVYLTGAKLYQGDLSTYQTVAGDVGYLIRSYVYNQNAFGVGSSASSNSITIVSASVAPVNTVAPVASVPYAVAGQTISVTDGTWSGDLPITYSYQWQVSANGVSGWSNVGTNANTLLISSGAAQLLFYRCVVTATNSSGFATANSNVVGGVDSQANSHYNRVTADSGVMTYGLIGVDTITKQLKYIYNVNDVSSLNIDGKWLDYFGYKAGSGSGSTAGRAIQKAYSILGANYDYIQNTTTAQPALGAWSQRNFISCFSTAGAVSTVKTNPNNSKITIIIEAYNAYSQYGVVLSHGSNWKIDNTFNTRPRFVLSDGTIVSSTADYPTGKINGFFRIVAENNGLNLIVQFATSSNGITYTQLGALVTANNKAGFIGSASASLFVASNAGPMIGDFYQVQVLDSTDSLIFNCQPSTYNRAVSANTFTANTGETYTLQVGTSATGLKTMMCDQTIIQGNGTSMGMQAASATINSLVFTQYNVWKKFSNAVAAVGVLNEYGSNVSSSQGLGLYPNENVNTESVYTNSNGGLNGNSWISSSLLLKVSTFRGDILGSPYEQGLATNNVNNAFNAVQAAGANTTAIVATGKNLLARNNAASVWGNFVWVGELMTTQTDTSGQETAIYNMLADGTNII